MKVSKMNSLKIVEEEGKYYLRMAEPCPKHWVNFKYEIDGCFVRVVCLDCEKEADPISGTFMCTERINNESSPSESYET